MNVKSASELIQEFEGLEKSRACLHATILDLDNREANLLRELVELLPRYGDKSWSHDQTEVFVWLHKKLGVKNHTLQIGLEP